MMVSVCFASNVYEVGNDVELDSTIYWPSDYKISMLAFDDADSTMLEWIYDMLTDIWNDMRAGFEFVDEDIVAGNTLLSQINVTGNSMYTLVDGMDSTLDYVLQGVGQTNGYLAITNNKLTDLIGTVGIGNSSLNDIIYEISSLKPFFYSVDSPYLSTDGQYVNPGGVQNLSFLVRSGFLGLRSLFTSINLPYLSSDGAYNNDGGTQSLPYLVRSGFLGLRTFLISTDLPYLSSDGAYNNNGGTQSLSYLVRSGFLGIGSFLTSTNASFLASDGTVNNNGGTQSLSYLVRSGLLGLDIGVDRLSTALSGSLTNHSYSGTSINNSNESTSFSATGLGPMLNTWLGDIQNDLGVLSYVFASPQDLELKEESADNMSAIGDSLLSPDSASSVKVSDIAGISEASTAIKGFGDTGVSIGQAFAQLGDASLFRFFSAEAAADLDSSVSTYSRDSSTQIVTSYFHDSREEFYEILERGEE